MKKPIIPWQNQAIISTNKKYRWWLGRFTNWEGPLIVYIGLNPSKADAKIDDATTLTWKRFTHQNGACGYLVVNPFALIATNYRDLLQADDPVGSMCDFYIHRALTVATYIVPCWGSRDRLPKSLHPRLDEVLNKIKQYDKPIYCFGVTKSGDPRHPLYLKKDTPFLPW